MSGAKTWTAKEVANLRTLWPESHSPTKIGERMNRSRHSITGQVHRLGLRGHVVEKEPPEIQRAAGSTLPPLRSLSVPIPVISI